MDDALVGSAVAEERERHLVRALDLRGERRAGADGHARGDDPVAPEDVEVERRDVHRAAQAPAVAVHAPHQLGHHAVHPGALGDRVAVAPVVARR